MIWSIELAESIHLVESSGITMEPEAENKGEAFL